MSRKIYDFDEPISRVGKNSAKWGEEYIGSGSDMLLPFWVADTDFRAPDEVNEALRACVDHGIYGYVRPSASCLQAAASWQQRRHGFQARPEWITVTPGIDCAMATAVQAFTEPGDKILINTPVYDPFFGVIEKNDRVTVDSPMVLTNGRYEFDWTDFEAKVRDCRMWMFCNPQNPEGRSFEEAELRRAGEKLENGMTGFLTQPVLSAQAVENLRRTRETFGERAKILAGIMPVVSQRNAIFMENEVNGIHVEADIIERFAGLDREQGEALGLEISLQMARAALPYADGFYLMTPFNRVALMERLIARLKVEVLG